MQVLSSRSNQSQRSHSFTRTNRKGLSLTTKSKCNSLPKPSYQLLQEQIHEKNHINNQESQTSIKFNLQKPPQQQNFFSIPNNCISFLTNQNCTSYLTEKPLLQKPKITFRYTSEINNQNQCNIRPNSFINDPSSPLHPSQIRSRFLPHLQVRNVVVTKSIETKNRNPIQSSLEKNQKTNKVLIDSRKIDREIIQQEIIHSFPTFSHNVPLTHKISVNPPLALSNLQYQIPHQDIQQSQNFLQQNSSPYHLLVSTAKKCESKQISPSYIQQSQVTEVFPQKNFTQIRQFHINQVVVQEHQQDSPQNSQIIDRVYNTQNQNVQEKLLDVKTQLSIQTQDQSQFLKIYSNNRIQEDKQINTKDGFKKSPQRTNKAENSQKSPKKILKKNVSQKILQDIENRPPESHSNPVLSGRRNTKRFKEIEKRLQEIISICGKNL